MAAALTLVSEVSGVSWARGLDGAECVWIGRGANRAVLHERATETYLLHVRAPEPTRLRLESWFGGRRSADWGTLAIAWGEGVCGGANGTHLFVETEEGWVLREAGTPFVEGPLPEQFVPLSGSRPCGLWKERTGHRVGALNGSVVAIGRTQPLVIGRGAGIALLEWSDECLVVRLGAETTVTSIGTLEPEAEVAGLHVETGVLLSTEGGLVLRSFEGEILDQVADNPEGAAFVGRGCFGWASGGRVFLRRVGAAETIELAIAGPGAARRCWTSGDRLFVEGGLENTGWMREYALDSTRVEDANELGQ